MKLSLRTLLCAAAMLLAGANAGRAEGLQLDEGFEPFGKPAPKATTISAKEITLVDQCNGDCNDQCCGSDRHVGRDFFVCRDRCGGVIGGMEWAFLRPYASDNALSPAGSTAQLNFESSWRTWVGYQSKDGLGGRFRYWEFDRADVTGAGSVLGMEFRTIDAELTEIVDYRRWSFLFAGGLRYAESNLNTQANGNAGVVDNSFHGVGLTAAAQAYRDINYSGSLRMAMGARWSAVYGNSSLGTSTAGPIPTLTTQFRDDLVNILELNIGPQYTRRMRNGWNLTMGGGLQAQYWSNGINVNTTGTDDVGFVGFGSSMQLSR